MPRGFHVGGPPKLSALARLRRRWNRWRKCRRGEHRYSADWCEFWTDSDSCSVWCVHCEARAEKPFAELGPAFETRRRVMLASMTNAPTARG